jgi:polyhydroxyalkanoate synthase subunit PhaC
MASKRGRATPTPAEPLTSESRNGAATPKPHVNGAATRKPHVNGAAAPKLSANGAAPLPTSRAPTSAPSTEAALAGGEAGQAKSMPSPVELTRQLAQIWAGQSQLVPDPKDRRFKDPAWTSNQFYTAWLQTYLAWGTWLDATVEAAGLERHDAGKASFIIEQIRDALSPTNFFWGNPAAIRRAFETGGASTLRGAANWLDDIAHNHGMPTQVDRRPFKVGETMAATPGAVVFRNELFELLQYTPQTEQVYRRPLLVVPPQVNRYYAVDLAPGRSLVEHLVKGGQQLFTIVWRNPTAEQRDWGLETYAQGILEASDVVRDITGSADVNAIGACAGGMTLAMLMAHLAATGDRRINAATLLVTMLDTSIESQLSLLADKHMLDMALFASQQAGILTGEQLGQVFSFLRPNDLIWNYWTNNYLLGEDPPAFDVLAWNSDATNLTARLHHDLIGLISSNALAKKGAVQLLGTPVDLGQVTCDTFVVAAQTDHITAWQGCYAATQLLGGKTQVVLCGSGHIQSIVSPPGNPRARFFVNPKAPADAKAWLAGATEQHGSWWDSYRTWLGERAGEQRQSPQELGSRAYPVLGAAPGTYVLES